VKKLGVFIHWVLSEPLNKSKIYKGFTIVN
jgi:hypothetical protein